MPTRHQEDTSGSHGFETPGRTCLLRVRTALHDLTGSEHIIVHAYNVSGRSCRISLVGNYRSYMPTRHQEGTSGSHGFETPDRTCLLGVRRALHDLTGSEEKIIHTYKVRHIRSNLPTRYQVGVAGSHGLGTTDRTCLLGIRMGLQDLTCLANQIRMGLQDLTDKDQPFKHAYEVSQRGCRISRVRNIKSNMPTRYQGGAAGSHG